MSKEVVKCKYCGKKFKAVPSADKKFCDEKCYGAWLSNHNKGKNNPSWTGATITKECKNCGKEFKSYQSKSQQFCSKECWHEYRKKQTAKRDKRVCTECGRELRLEAFRKDSGQTDGYDRYCKKCRRKMEREAHYRKKRYDSSAQVRLNDNMSGAIYKSLRDNKKGQHWEDLVGYTLKELKQRIECQFEKGMSWKNHGYNGWHIDHRKPKSAFNYESPDEQAFKDCWSLVNLQPLWSKENIKKSDKFPYEKE